MATYDADIEAILERRRHNGADFWATPDGRIYVGNPFSTVSAPGMLHELGVSPGHEAARGGLALILEACREDGESEWPQKLRCTLAIRPRRLEFCVGLE